LSSLTYVSSYSLCGGDGEGLDVLGYEYCHGLAVVGEDHDGDALSWDYAVGAVHDYTAISERR